MDRIHLLGDHLISQIAAGEVVERPASVVKELIENSLDAGASSVEVQLVAGGKRSIWVRDNGSGMGRNDVLLAFDRHATSKIGSAEDLSGISTLGFRGEALAAIAAVSRIELVSAEEPGEGILVRIEGGRVKKHEPASHPRGTTVEVDSLFFNVPARRKFTKQPSTELRRCVEVIQGYALSRPDVHFRLSHEGRILLDSPSGRPGQQGARDRIGQIFGAALAEELVEIAGPEQEGEAIWGYVGGPGTTRGRRLFVFVNRRLLRDRAILATFYRSVREVWKSDDFPALFLFLDLPFGAVDVNVHPQKSEVRFRDPRLLGRVGAKLRAALEAARGEEAAALRSPQGPPGPLAWSGLGRDPAAGPSPWFPASREALPDLIGENLGWKRVASMSITPQQRAPVPLSGRNGVARPFRLLGQYKGALILLEGPDGLFLIDQHVAHERILYERYRRSLEGQRVPVQQLVTPLLLELGAAERMHLEDLIDALDRRGFSLRRMSEETLALMAVPADLSVDSAQAALLELASEEEGKEAGAVEDLDRLLLEKVAASLSCKAAVKMHHPLTADEMESLVAELFRAEQPYACPHGRPIVLTLTDADLERRFGRR
ncbi:MAG TPA: DNA mismatch repair endonuclease MutL [Thermoanaerobaculia bacterium]|nr:DNA mismatch repair endonuclease MutL [Thermoanaerobaculia bacterium]